MNRAVLVAGGWAHPPDDMIAAMSELLTEVDHRVDTVTDPRQLAPALDEPVDLLVVAACWFAMDDARYTASQRSEWAVELDEQSVTRLTDMKAAGCPLLGLHTAPICFDGWPLWHDWLGATWDWATSWHPEPALLAVEMAAESPFHLAPFTVVDEEYQGLVVDNDVKRVAQSVAGHPLVWRKHTSAGRAAVNLLGHDRRSLDAPAHRALNRTLIAWLVNVPNANA